MTEWYSRSEEEVLRELSSCRRGLTDAEAHSRLEKYGEKAKLLEAVKDCTLVADFSKSV